MRNPPGVDGHGNRIVRDKRTRRWVVCIELGADDAREVAERLGLGDTVGSELVVLAQRADEANHRRRDF